MRLVAGDGWWGATEAERRMPLPGDDLVPAPMVELNHGLTIEARPDQVWPWLVQLVRASFHKENLSHCAARPVGGSNSERP